MVSKVLSAVCFLCVVLFPAVWADDCGGFWDSEGNYFDPVPCGWNHCCGNCNDRYCCNENNHHLTQEQQELCPESFEGNVKSAKAKNIARLAGAIIGSVLFALLLVGLIVCCVAPCCLCYKWRRRRHRNVISTTTVVHVPPSVSPAGHQPSYPGYQPVPFQPGSSMPMPTAPPSYLEATDLVHSPLATDPGHHMHPYPSHPPPSDERIQLPYNPAYYPNP